MSLFSRVLTKTEKRYSTFDLELLAEFAAVNKRKYFKHDNVTIFTDHTPLVEALKNLKEYITDVVYIVGRENVVVGTLFRTNVIGNVAACYSRFNQYS